MKPRHYLPLGVCLLGASLLVAHQLWAQQRVTLRAYVFELPGTELGLDVADMNGDGRSDLVIAHMAAPEAWERSISIFYQRPGRQRWSAEPDLVWSVPVDACAFVAGDLDGAPGGEVALLCPTRLVVIRGTGQSVEVGSVECFFDYPEDGGLPVWTLCQDLDGDGRLELLVPTKDGYTVFARRGPGSLEPISHVEVPIEQRFGPDLETTLLGRFLSATSRLRRVVVCDMDRDGRSDLVAYREHGLARFLQRDDGSFPERPDQEGALAVVEQTDQEGQRKENTEAFANVRIDLRDLDGDGMAELIATRTLGEIGVFETMRSQQVICRGLPNGAWNEAAPDVVVNLPGVSPQPTFVDWDGDGRLDLVVASYRVDLFENVKRAIFDEMRITYYVFLQRDSPMFDEDEPDYELEVDVELRALERRGGLRAVLFDADLDGDGLNDQVRLIPDEDDEHGRRAYLRAWLGARDDDGEFEFSDEPIELEVRRSEPPWAVDLDGDGRDELILEPFGGDDEAARRVVVVGAE
jgi:FG-GAP-like repeat